MITERMLCVIDGGKGLRKAVQHVPGTAAAIQRRQIHKARNLQALLPKVRQAHVRATLRRAYGPPVRAPHGANSRPSGDGSRAPVT